MQRPKILMHFTHARIESNIERDDASARSEPLVSMEGGELKKSTWLGTRVSSLDKMKSSVNDGLAKIQGTRSSPVAPDVKQPANPVAPQKNLAATPPPPRHRRHRPTVAHCSPLTNLGLAPLFVRRYRKPNQDFCLRFGLKAVRASTKNSPMRGRRVQHPRALMTSPTYGPS